MSQARYHDRMKVRAYLQDLWPYIDLQRPLQFRDDVWNAFYKTKVQLKATKDLVAAKHDLEAAREAWKSDGDLNLLEVVISKLQVAVDKVPNVTHRLGQGGLLNLKAAFVSSSPPAPYLHQSVCKKFSSPPAPGQFFAMP